MNLTRSRFARVATLGATTATFGGVAFASPAHAAPAPSCVTTSLNSSGYTDYLTVINHCSQYKRVKVILHNGPDTPCVGINAGDGELFSWVWPESFNRLDSC